MVLQAFFLIVAGLLRLCHSCYLVNLSYKWSLAPFGEVYCRGGFCLWVTLFWTRFFRLGSLDHFSIVSLSNSSSYCGVCALSFQEMFASNNTWIFSFACGQWYLLSCSDGTWGHQKTLLESRNTWEVGAPMLKALDSAKDLQALACDCLPENPYVILEK